MHERRNWLFSGIFVLHVCASVFGIGCAQQAKEATVKPSVQDVRGDSDRFFNKMELEEQEKSSR